MVKIQNTQQINKKKTSKRKMNKTLNTKEEIHTNKKKHLKVVREKMN